MTDDEIMALFDQANTPTTITSAHAEWHKRILLRFARNVLAAVAPRSCNACLWIGPASETVMCGSVGPLCPECNETTEAVHLAAAPVARSSICGRCDGAGQVPTGLWETPYANCMKCGSTGVLPNKA